MRCVNRNLCWDINIILCYVLNILFRERLYLGDGEGIVFLSDVLGNESYCDFCVWSLAWVLNL